jgi:hypothetical protein
MLSLIIEIAYIISGYCAISCKISCLSKQAINGSQRIKDTYITSKTLPSGVQTGNSNGVNVSLNEQKEQIIKQKNK